MRRLRLWTLLACLAVLAAPLGCYYDDNDGTDEVDAGDFLRGESKVVKARAFIGYAYLDECDDARIRDVRGPGGSQPPGENVDADVVGIVRQSDDGECVVEIDIIAFDDAELGSYTIEVEFDFFISGEPFEYETSGYVYLRVVAD